MAAQAVAAQAVAAQAVAAQAVVAQAAITARVAVEGLALSTVVHAVLTPATKPAMLQQP